MKLIVEKIIISLIDTGRGLTARELAERAEASESNIKHNISLVRDELREFGLGISSIPSEGYVIGNLSGNFEENIVRLKNFMAHDPSTSEYRINYIMDALLNYEKSYSVNLFMEELHVSRGVIESDFKRLNSDLETFHVRLLTKRNSGVVFEGNEFEIRQAIAYFQNSRLFETTYLPAPQQFDPRLSDRAWTYISEYYTKEIESVLAIQRCINKAESHLGEDFSDIAYGRLLEYILISQRRVRQGKCIRTDLPGERLPLGGAYLEAADLFRPLFKGQEKDIWKYERRYLAARIYVTETVNGRNRGDERDRELAEALLNRLWEFDSPRFVPEPELIDRVAELIDTMRYRENYRIADWLDISGEVGNRYASLFALCMVHASVFEEQTKLRFRKDDIALLVLIIMNYQQAHRREAVLVTASRSEVSSYHLLKLQEAIPELNFTACEYYKEFRPEAHAGRLVVSSANLKGGARNLIRITKHVTDDDIELVRRQLTRLDSGGEIIPRIYQESLILDLVAVDKEDALTQIAERMKLCGYVEDGFYDEVMRREEQYSTMIGKGLAIPHVYLKSVRKSGVSVVRLKNRVRWSEKGWVDIIFCFAIGNEARGDIKQIFRHMYRIFGDDALIDAIRGAGSGADVLSLLLNNC